MDTIKALLILAAIAGLFLAAANVVILDSATQARRMKYSEDFQRLVGGLGFGPALELASCPARFDPRLDPGGADGDDFLLGLARDCPQHGGSIFYYPPLEPSGPTFLAGE
jgi:hypothetical protein